MCTIEYSNDSAMMYSSLIFLIFNRQVGTNLIIPADTTSIGAHGKLVIPGEVIFV